ncbi:MAG: hypothetical protein ACI9LL_001033 [Porticoccus sp.]
MKCNIKSLSWSEEKTLAEKQLKLIKKSEIKLMQMGYTLVSRNTYWIVYDLAGHRQVFENPEDLYKYSYRRRYNHTALKTPTFVVK